MIMIGLSTKGVNYFKYKRNLKTKLETNIYEAVMH